MKKIKKLIFTGSLVIFFIFNFNSIAETNIESETNIGVSSEDETNNIQTENKVTPDPLPTAPPSDLVPKSLVQLGEGDWFSSYALILDKSTRTLSIWQYQNTGIKLVDYYPADMGRSEGNKTVVGDLKTPEGIYFFQNKYEDSQLDFNEYGSRAFTMDYPNVFDKNVNKTGSGIWLHAIPETKSLLRGSRGCVVVRNSIIQKISEYISLKQTPIIVHEKVEYVNPIKLTEAKNNVISWLNNWRQSWESKDIDNYINFYSSVFKSMGMNLDQWKTYKDSLNQKYKTIQVKLSNPIVILHNDHAVVRFLQSYQSDQKSDFGEKTLYLELDSTKNSYVIVSEEWSPTSKQISAKYKEFIEKM